MRHPRFQRNQCFLLARENVIDATGMMQPPGSIALAGIQTFPDISEIFSEPLVSRGVGGAVKVTAQDDRQVRVLLARLIYLLHVQAFLLVIGRMVQMRV